MIEDPINPAKSLLAVYANGTVRYTDKLQTGSEVLVPLSLTDSLIEAHLSGTRGRGLWWTSTSHGRRREPSSTCLDADFNSLLLMMAHVSALGFPKAAVCPLPRVCRPSQLRENDGACAF